MKFTSIIKRVAKRLLPGVAVAVVCGMMVPASSAQETTWIGQTGNWFDSTNWTNGVPDETVTARLSILTPLGLPEPKTAQLNSATTVRYLHLGKFLGTGRLLVNGGYLTCDPKAGGPFATTDHYIGLLAYGQMDVVFGDVDFQNTSTHIGELGTGVVNVWLGDVRFRNSTFAVGNLNGTGTINVGGVGTAYPAFVIAGDTNATGTRATGFLGLEGTGILNIANGGNFIWAHPTQRLDLGRLGGSGEIVQDAGTATFDAGLDFYNGIYRVNGGMLQLDSSGLQQTFEFSSSGTAHFLIDSGSFDVFEDVDAKITFDASDNNPTPDLSPRTASVTTFSQSSGVPVFSSLCVGVDDADANDGNLVLDLNTDVRTEQLTMKGGTNYQLTLPAFQASAKLYHRVNGQLVALIPGDANLDGVVDVSDLQAWNANKFTSGTDWGKFDFNGDRVTDVSDYQIWNNHKFTGPYID